MKFPPIPEVVWQQPLETKMKIIHKDSNIEYHKNTHTPELQQCNDVESQTSPIKETSPQNSGTNKEPFVENQTMNIPAQCLIDYQEQQLEIHKKRCFHDSQIQWR